MNSKKKKTKKKKSRNILKIFLKISQVSDISIDRISGSGWRQTEDEIVKGISIFKHNKDLH